MKFIRELCWWLPQCKNCGSRQPRFNDGLCFDCSVAESKARMWRGIADAIVQIAPTFVQAMADYGTCRVRRYSRRNPARLKPPAVTELDELRKMAGLPPAGGVEKSKPEQDEKPGEAETNA